MSIHNLTRTLFEEKPNTIEALVISEVKTVKSFSADTFDEERSLVTFENDDTHEFYDITDVTSPRVPTIGDYLVKDNQSFGWVFKRKAAFNSQYVRAREQ